MSNTFRKDGPWAWICLAAAFVNFMILGGMGRAFGIWYVEIVETLDGSAAVTSWMNGINFGLKLIFSPLVSAICHRWPANYVAMAGGFIYGSGVFISAWVTDPRILLLTYGVVGGIGASASHLVPFKVLSDYFDKYRGIAISVVMCGFGTGTFTFSFIYLYIFANMTYFEAVTIISGIVFNLMVTGAILMPRTADVNSHENTIKGEDQRLASSLPSMSADRMPESIVRDEQTPLISESSARAEKEVESSRFNFDLLTVPIVWLIMIIGMISSWCSLPYTSMIVDFAVERGIPESSAGVIVTFNGLTDVITRLVYGLVIQHRLMSKYRFYIWSFFCFTTGIVTALTTLSTNLIQFISVSSLCASFIGGIFICGPLIMALIFQESAYSDMMGLFSFGVGVGSITGSLLAGALKDMTHSYVISYFSMGGAAFIAGVLVLSTIFLIKLYGQTRNWYLKIDI